MNRYSITERQRYIEDFKKSGLSQNAFSEKNNITKSTLSYWLKKGNSSEQFVNITEKLTKNTRHLSDITLLINDSIKITLSHDYDDAFLQRLLRTLGVSL